MPLPRSGHVRCSGTHAFDERRSCPRLRRTRLGQQALPSDAGDMQATTQRRLCLPREPCMATKRAPIIPGPAPRALRERYISLWLETWAPLYSDLLYSVRRERPRSGDHSGRAKAPSGCVQSAAANLVSARLADGTMSVSDLLWAHVAVQANHGRGGRGGIGNARAAALSPPY